MDTDTIYRGKGRVPEEIDHSVIALDRGSQREIAMRWGISEATTSRYLNGLFSKRSKNLKLALQVREYARTFNPGASFYIVKDDATGVCRGFRNLPRRDSFSGVWFDSVERSSGREPKHPVFPEELLPDGITLTFQSRPLKVKLTIIQ